MSGLTSSAPTVANYYRPNFYSVANTSRNAIHYYEDRNLQYDTNLEVAARIREENAVRRKANFIKQKKAKSQMKTAKLAGEVNGEVGL